MALLPFPSRSRCGGAAGQAAMALLVACPTAASSLARLALPRPTTGFFSFSLGAMLAVPTLPSA